MLASEREAYGQWEAEMASGEQQQPVQRTRPDYDTVLKRMLTRSHDGFLKLLASDDRWIAERPTELRATARRVDLVWEVESQTGERGLTHIELQIQPDANIGERMAEYGVGLWLRDHLPVHSVVVFLRPAATIPSSPFVIQWKGQET